MPQHSVTRLAILRAAPTAVLLSVLPNMVTLPFPNPLCPVSGVHSRAVVGMLWGVTMQTMRKRQMDIQDLHLMPSYQMNDLSECYRI